MKRLRRTIHLLGFAVPSCLFGCTPAQSEQVKQAADRSMLVYGERETVCALVEQVATAQPNDERVKRAQELCRGAATLQEIVDSVATPCEDRP